MKKQKTMQTPRPSTKRVYVCHTVFVVVIINSPLVFLRVGKQNHLELPWEVISAAYKHIVVIFVSKLFGNFEKKKNYM